MSNGPLERVHFSLVANVIAPEGREAISLGLRWLWRFAPRHDGSVHTIGNRHSVSVCASGVPLITAGKQQPTTQSLMKRHVPAEVAARSIRGGSGIYRQWCIRIHLAL